MIDKLIPRLVFAGIGLAWVVFSYAAIVGMMRFGFNLSATLAVVVPIWLIAWIYSSWRQIDREWHENVDNHQFYYAEWGYRQQITDQWAMGLIPDDKYHKLTDASKEREAKLPPLRNGQG